MDHRSKLVGAALLALAGMAHAYVSPSPPAGFGGTPGAWTWSPPTAAQQLGGIMRGPGPNVPGLGATNAAFRFGPAAARTLAKGIIGGGVAGAAIIGAAWLLQNCFEKQGDGTWKRVCGNAPGEEISDGWLYYVSDSQPIGQYKPSPTSACQSWASSYIDNSVTWTFKGLGATYNGIPQCNMGRVNKIQNGNCVGPIGTACSDYLRVVTKTPATCPAGWYVTPAGCVATPSPNTVTPQQVEDEMATKPLPSTIPAGFPLPLHIDNPLIWNPTPLDPATGQPLRQPMGSPRPVPNTNPQQYTQPMTDWYHVPTSTDPWRLDPQPRDVSNGTDPIGRTEPGPLTSGNTQGTPDDQLDLCQLHPDIIACQKTDELEATELKTKTVDLSFAADSGWGPDNASCPPAKTVAMLGGSYSFSVKPLCDFASMIRPLIVAFAALSAALIFMGVARRES